MSSGATSSTVNCPAREFIAFKQRGQHWHCAVQRENEKMALTTKLFEERSGIDFTDL